MASTRFVPTIGVLVLMLGACSSGPEEDPFASLATSLNLTTSSMGDETTGDGDGDPTTTGDGDPSTGDGDPTTSGDGDPTTSGDGDPTTGDGDGDPTTTSGDGDPTTTGDGDPPTNCGWYDDPTFPGYYCGGVGTDPAGMHPYTCPGGLVEGAPCGRITGAGCCDANGDNWYCAGDGGGATFLVKEDC
jgi:hypothetical protein